MLKKFYYHQTPSMTAAETSSFANLEASTPNYGSGEQKRTNARDC